MSLAIAAALVAVAPFLDLLPTTIFTRDNAVVLILGDTSSANAHPL
jgi:hypothetical protein